MESGAQPGNQNALKNKPWADALRRALSRAKTDSDYRDLNKLADALIDKAFEGDIAALKELGDRLDGRPAQAIVGDTDQPPVQHNLKVEMVGAVQVHD